MKSIIKELWRGNVMPPEDGRRNSPEMTQLLEYISRHSDDLQKTCLTNRKKSSKSFMIVGTNTQVFLTRLYSIMHFVSAHN